MEYVRNHINPALLIKRFKPSKSDVMIYFPDSKKNYDDKEKPPVVRLKKSSFFEKSGEIKIEDHTYTNTKANGFIKEKIYFLDSSFLNSLIYKAKSKKAKKKIKQIVPASLEISLGTYESLISPIFDNHLPTNFTKLTENDKRILLKFWDCSYLRPLKYKKFQNYLSSNDIDNHAELLAAISKKEIDFSEILKDKTFEESVIIIIIFIDYLKRKILNGQDLSQCTDETRHKIKNIEESIAQTPTFLHYFKNEESLKDKNNAYNIPDTNLMYVKNKNGKFILGDNTVSTIYKNYNSNIIDDINNYLLDKKIIEKALNKVSIMVVSPNNIIIKTDDNINICNVDADDEFVKIINSVTLFNTDEWIVSQDILKNSNEVIDIDIYNKIKQYDFFEKETLNFLLDFNYNIGIKNKFQKFNEFIYKPLILEIEKYLNFNEDTKCFDTILIPATSFDCELFKRFDFFVFSYFKLNMNLMIQSKYRHKLDEMLNIYLVKFEENKNPLIHSIFDNIDINIEYDYLLITKTEF